MTYTPIPDPDSAAAVDALLAAGVAGATPDYVGDNDDGPEIAAIYTVPTGYRLEVVALEGLRAAHRAAPMRKSGSYTVRDVASFLAYYEKHAEDGAEVWVTPRSVTAVLNANGPEIGGARWEDHRVTLILTHSAEWVRWDDISGKLLSQTTFADFLEGAAGDVQTPDMATVLEVASSLEASTKVEFESAYRTQDGQRAFKYRETTTAKAGQKGELEIPTKLVLALRIYEGLDPALITARFRYRITGDALHLGIVIDRIPEILENALTDVKIAIAEGIDRGFVMVGTAP